MFRRVYYIEEIAKIHISKFQNEYGKLVKNIKVYDLNLSKEFLDKYQTEQIKFVKCTLGNYSLNDERFILYYMFFLKHKVNNILFTDGNDVIINKSPFQFFESKKVSNKLQGSLVYFHKKNDQKDELDNSRIPHPAGPRYTLENLLFEDKLHPTSRNKMYLFFHKK